MATSIITVYDRRLGQYKQDAKVVLSWNGFVNLGMSDAVYTDRDGNAVINHSATGDADIYVDGSKVGMLYTPGSKTVQV